ncbi:MAG TPA: hypothetical protein VFW14_16370 [Gaiellales bacterium]|nr:hypothetical protein [Gaiellales bacterium]
MLPRDSHNTLNYRLQPRRVTVSGRRAHRLRPAPRPRGCARRAGLRGLGIVRLDVTPVSGQTTAAGAQNLVVTNAIRSQLLAAGAALHTLPVADYSTRPPATDGPAPR